MARCADPLCDNEYTPTRGWQKYCCARCRNSHRNRATSTARKVLARALAWFAGGGGFALEARLRDACDEHQGTIRGEEEQ